MLPPTSVVTLCVYLRYFRRLAVRPGALFAVLLFAATTASAQVSFDPKVDFPSGVHPVTVAYGDLNGDGRTDIVNANQGGTVSVHLNDGGGGLLSKTDFPAGADPFRAVVADVNLDGKPDVIVVNSNPQTVSVLLGDGNGGLGTPSAFSTAPSPSAVAVADLNNDRHPDLIVSTWGISSAVSVLLGTGTGSFGPKTDFPASASLDIVAADFNRDGNIDIAVADLDANIASILLGNGTGSLGAKTNFATGVGPVSIAAADVNSDGKLDLVTGNMSGHNVSILLGTGAGSFSAKTDFAGPVDVRAATVADIDCDGKLDIVVLGGTLGVLRGVGDGTFLAASTFPFSVGFPRNVAAVDLDGDIRPDVVAAAGASNKISVMMNRTAIVPGGVFAAKVDFAAPAAPGAIALGDFNRDGHADAIVSSQTNGGVSILLGTGGGGFGPKTAIASFTGGPVAVADFNGDGKLDVALMDNDLRVYLGNGLGGFNNPLSTSLGFFPGAIVAADVTLDGKPDLVLTNPDNDSVVVRAGNGNGTFTPFATHLVGDRPRAALVADLNRTGVPEIVVLNEVDGTVSILGDLGNGFRHDFAAGSSPAGLAVADVNADGWADLVTTSDSFQTPDVLVVLLGTGAAGAGAFDTPITDLAAGTGLTAAAVADFNRDGRLDLTTVDGPTGQLLLFAGWGDGTFQTPSIYLTGLAPSALAIADLNHDGRLDVVTVDAGSDTVSVFLNIAPTVADLSVSIVDAPDPVTVDQNLTYTVTVTNNGPNPALAVAVQWALPAGTEFISRDPSCLYFPVLVCQVGSLGVGANATIVNVVSPTTSGTLQTAVTVAGTVVDTVSANNSAVATTTVPLSPPVFLTPPQDAVAIADTTQASFAAIAVGAPNPEYRWQISTDGANWTDLANVPPHSGVATNILHVDEPPKALNGARYRAVATNSQGEVASLPATLTVTAAPSTELVTNGSFGLGMAGWKQFATPDLSYIVSQITSGVFEYYRVAPAPGTTNQAVVFQETGVGLFADSTVEATFDLGNSSTTRKRISVLILDSDFSDLSVCTFWLPPNTPLQTYQMRTHTTTDWSNAAIYFYAATPGSDGGFNRIDNVSFRYTPGGSTSSTECLDPLAPAPPGGISSATLVTNGDFSLGLAAWSLFGQITQQIVNGVFEFYRPPGTPAGVVFQPTGSAFTTNQIVTVNLDLGNSSAVRKRVTVVLHDGDFNDLSACTFWLAPGQSLSPYALRTYATKPWTNATVSVYPATIGTDEWIRLDNVALRRTPAASVVGTTCAEPGIAPLAGG